jgi:membrane associated rhomboid family serine protease
LADGFTRNILDAFFIVYRLNTYPIIHKGFFHALLNSLALAPLLERFEAEHGTLTAVALFVGRMFFLIYFAEFGR